MSTSEEAAGEQSTMRPVFTCMVCGCVYLPPKSMEYPRSGAKASPLHCGSERCRRQCAALPGRLRAVMARAAWAQAERWLNRDLSALPERARARAGKARPGGRRSKLR
ncbi:hypothetical protein J1792_32900 [Streptomyces triculaminicus]|uniref:Uncharacterized protein n=2 Tax=Streptomyces TaxID=1883 RepID=A0A939FU10_9ACTN|nr:MULTISPECIES: hypothetical protein [Streptomyces]MBO0657339.1 hypothetical protein [Streptomyces triculaminicus]QSY49349.1 hypothetical protein J3S04_31210 [Streptomyces griseocarneus]